MKTVLLTRSEVRARVEGLLLLRALRDGFARVGAAPTQEGGLQVAELAAPGGPLWLVRRRQDPLPCCVLHAGHLRTLTCALTGALAADVLARPDASRVALVGATEGAAAHLKSLRLVRSLTHLRIFDAEGERAELLAARLHLELSLPTRTALTAEEAVGDADLVVVTAPTRPPVLLPGMVLQGAHVNCALDLDGGASAQLLGASQTFDAHALARLISQGKTREGAEAVTVFCAELPDFARAAAAQLVLDAVDPAEDLPRIDFSA